MLKDITHTGRRTVLVALGFLAPASVAFAVTALGLALSEYDLLGAAAMWAPPASLVVAAASVLLGNRRVADRVVLAVAALTVTVLAAIAVISMMNPPL